MWRTFFVIPHGLYLQLRHLNVSNLPTYYLLVVITFCSSIIGGERLKELLAIGSNAISSSRNMAIDTSRDHEFTSAPHTPTRNVGVVGGGTARNDVVASPLAAAGAALSGPSSPSGAPPGLSAPSGPGNNNSSNGSNNNSNNNGSLLGPGDDYPPQQKIPSPPQPQSQNGGQSVPPPAGVLAPPGIPSKPADVSNQQTPNQQYEIVASANLQTEQIGAPVMAHHVDSTHATYMYATMSQPSSNTQGGTVDMMQQSGVSMGYAQSSTAPGYAAAPDMSAIPTYGGVLPTFMVPNNQSTPMLAQLGMPAQYVQATPVMSMTDMSLYGQPMFIQQAPPMQQMQQHHLHQQQHQQQHQHQQQQQQQHQQQQQQQQQQHNLTTSLYNCLKILQT